MQSSPGHEAVFEGSGSNMSLQPSSLLPGQPDFTRKSSIRRSFRAPRRQLGGGIGGSTSPGQFRRTPSMRNTARVAVLDASADAQRHDDSTDASMEDGDIAEEMVAQLGQMNDALRQMAKSQEEKEQMHKSDGERLIQENGRLLERCTAVEQQLEESKCQFRDQLQREREQFIQAQERSERDNAEIIQRLEDEIRKMKDSAQVQQLESISAHTRMSAEIERLKSEREWMNDNAERQSATAHQMEMEQERLKRENDQRCVDADVQIRRYAEEAESLRRSLNEATSKKPSGADDSILLIGELREKVIRLEQVNSELREEVLQGPAAPASSADYSLASQIAQVAIGAADSQLRMSNGQMHVRKESVSDGSSSSCGTCVEKEEECKNLKTYLTRLVQRVLEINPDILEIRGVGEVGDDSPMDTRGDDQSTSTTSWGTVVRTTISQLTDGVRPRTVTSEEANGSDC